LKRAFTLIELLVVIAIIAILAAILFPVFASAKEAAKKTNALSNGKQLQLAFLMYINDADGVFMNRYNAPPETGPVAPYTDQNMIWTGQLYPYVKNQGVFLDPVATNAAYATDWPDRGGLPMGYNSTASGWYIPGTPDNLNLPDESKWDNSSGVVTFMSSTSGLTANGYRGYLAENDAVDTTGLEISDRHVQGTIVAMLDGHAKWYKTVAILGNPNIPYTCTDFSFYTGYYWLDLNAAHLKMNLQDPCVPNP
jgi:prepilin-type N-terminal cleavage/methylation domain-containing protein